MGKQQHAHVVPEVATGKNSFVIAYLYRMASIKTSRTTSLLYIIL